MTMKTMSTHSFYMPPLMDFSLPYSKICCECFQGTLFKI